MKCLTSVPGYRVIIALRKLEAKDPASTAWDCGSQSEEQTREILSQATLALYLLLVSKAMFVITTNAGPGGQTRGLLLTGTWRLVLEPPARVLIAAPVLQLSYFIHFRGDRLAPLVLLLEHRE